MLALTIEETQVRAFMNRLLREETFDALDVRKADIVAEYTVSIDGTRVAAETGETGDNSEIKETRFIKWASLREFVTSFIRAAGKPKQMKVVFSLPEGEADALHNNAAALFINLLYENNAVVFTTATAQKMFALDKSLDHAWDDWVLQFLARHGIPVTEKE